VEEKPELIESVLVNASDPRELLELALKQVAELTKTREVWVSATPGALDAAGLTREVRRQTCTHEVAGWRVQASELGSWNPWWDDSVLDLEFYTADGDFELFVRAMPEGTGEAVAETFHALWRGSMLDIEEALAAAQALEESPRA
jgi:hypothetical protein